MKSKYNFSKRKSINVDESKGTQLEDFQNIEKMNCSKCGVKLKNNENCFLNGNRVCYECFRSAYFFVRGLGVKK